MVFPHYSDDQPPAVPYPADYSDRNPQREKRSPVLAASLAGLIAVLVLAVGVLLGLQFKGSDQGEAAPVLPHPSTSVAASEPSVVVPTSEPEPPSSGAQQRRAQEAARLDRSTYDSLSTREFALMVKDPDSWSGRKVVVYGVITQFDAATGTTAFRADTGPAPVSGPYDYDQNTFLTAHDAGMVANIVEKDMVTMYVEVQGALTYETQIGGSATVPSLLVNVIEPQSVTRSASPRPATVGPLPAPLPDIDSASASQLRNIAAADQPIVLAGLAEHWVPQLSSKRPGLVAEGRTWTNATTLAEHQKLRQSYPAVRLLWSGDWSTFSESNFWVTIVGTGFPTADGALAWCRSAGLDRDHCFAKLVSTTHPIKGSTDYN